MASALYPKFREKCLTKTGPSFTTQNIKCGFVSTKYDYSTSHEFLSSVLSTQMVKRSTTNLASKTNTNGVAAAANMALPTVTGVKCEAIVLWRDTGSSGTSDLLAYIDTATGLPFTPTGTAVTIAWSTGTNKIFKL